MFDCSVLIAAAAAAAAALYYGELTEKTKRSTNTRPKKYSPIIPENELKCQEHSK